MRDQENALFDEWRRKDSKVIRDGVVDEEVYRQSNPKILYVLKEVNSVKDAEKFDLRDFLKTTDRVPTWSNISLWTFGIRNIDKEFSWAGLKEKAKDNAFRKAQLRSIAALNLKKITGGHTAKSKEIETYASKNKDFLKKQFEIYNADIIICCGSIVGWTLRKEGLLTKFDTWSETRRGITYHSFGNNQIIINYCHPEARIEDSIKYYALMDAVRELRIPNEN